MDACFELLVLQLDPIFVYVKLSHAFLHSPREHSNLITNCTKKLNFITYKENRQHLIAVTSEI
jgi:hypothetical protein